MNQTTQDFYTLFVDDTHDILQMVAFGIYKTDEAAFIKLKTPSEVELSNYMQNAISRKQKYYEKASVLVNYMIYSRLEELQDLYKSNGPPLGGSFINQKIDRKGKMSTQELYFGDASPTHSCSHFEKSKKELKPQHIKLEASEIRTLWRGAIQFYEKKHGKPVFGNALANL